ncbi:flagellar biosynthesis anti-sigma factor FlgM [Bacillus sp. 2205SS5-2]|uniref:flagellar biosynthesis anti-sigma factor FlgM n=1 Tax=Bacillus sp. 2205SS5-2 TaxID=3109031 RepID=UPI0030045838
MKINPNRINSVNPYQKQMNKIDQADTKKAPQDKVEISSAAKEMREASKISKEREVKVNQLKELVESGQYKVDHKAVATSIAKYYQSF